MKKNDKLVAVLGVAILIIAAIGIYYWAEEPVHVTADVEDFFVVTGDMMDTPEAIAVSDSCPFYALIATPVAINYDSEGYESVIPLYVINYDDTSRAIDRTIDLVGIDVDEEVKDDDITPKELSLDYAQRFWKSSEGALLIEYSQEGYNLGVLATPLASYFSIPVIVTEEVDADVREVFADLGVERTIVCGDLEGYGDVLKFKDVDEVVEATTMAVKDKFGEVDYITITNPIDIHKPKVMESKTFEFDGSIQGFSLAPSQMSNTLRNIGKALGAAGTKLGTIRIPDEWKYTLMKFDGIAEYKGKENPDLFGSSVAFEVAGDYEIFASGLGTASGIPKRDSDGKIIEDRIYSENVAYDLGGEEFNVKIKQATLFVTSTANAKVTITLENLSDPMYPMMKQLSSMAPYLTAYRKGIIFGKPEFAFVADDHIRTARDETCPGVYQVRSNHKLQYPSNMHVFDIHDQINELLVKLADDKEIDLEELGGLKELRDYYEDDPVYICLVGGSVVLPQIIYDSYLTPAGDNYLSLKYGVGIPTDIIYGNIDPIPNTWDMITPDVYYEGDNEFIATQENIVGRITGWDVQDASALIARTVFYENIIGESEFADWKKSATVQTGCGTDFLKPPLASLVRKLTGKDDIVKWYSGNTKYTGDSLQKEVLEPIGYKVYRTEYTESQVKGFTAKAISDMRTTNLLSRLFFGSWLTKKISGADLVKGGQRMEECNIIWQNAHGMPNYYEFGDAMTNTLGFRPLLYIIANWITRAGVPGISKMFNTAMTGHGTNNIRNTEYMELGPSVSVIESCFTGKIDGMYPPQAICQTVLHAGVNAVIASPTETNVPGGYLDPYLEKGVKWDRYNVLGRIAARSNARKGIYPAPHFGGIIYKDFYNNLGQGQDVGTALRNARNDYLSQDWDSTFKWVPPLAAGGKGLAPNVPEHKYLAYQEYCLYADPAFMPYVPNL